MRWAAEERLRRALPYGMWKWSDNAGVITETIFNRHYRALAPRVDGQLVTPTRDPPRPLWRAAEYFYGDGTNSPMNGFPWRERIARSAAEKVLNDWGLDPGAQLAEAAAGIREERRYPAVEAVMKIRTDRANAALRRREDLSIA